MKKAALLLVACALAACGGSKARIEKLDRGAVVLAFGDSLTFGTGAGKEESFPAVLERSTGLKVANAGVPGEISAEGLARLPAAIEEAQPKLVILCHGGNDFLRRMDEAAAARNIREMIKLARGKGIPVVLIATPKPTLPPSVPKFYAEIAAELAVPLDDEVMNSVLRDNRLKSDIAHPNASGYAEIAAAVEKLLRKSGAI
jgi:lysophospholipase L1-like esterase